MKPQQQLSKRVTNEWQEIGFQGSDPATDFRGAGLLGLTQLLKLCEADSQTHDQALQMYSDSLINDHWYFFAVTGINITQKLLKSLKMSTFDETILSIISEKGVNEATVLMEAIDYWYFKVFMLFNEKWKQSKVGIMEFNQFLERVYDNDFLPNHHKYLQEYLDQKNSNAHKQNF